MAISVRTPPPIVPRDPFGMPVQRTSMLLSALRPAIANQFGRLTARVVLGDLTRIGLPRSDFTPYSTKRVPLIDVGFVQAVTRGRIAVKRAVERLTRTSVVFADGSSEAFDAVIAATGYGTSLRSLIDLPDVLDVNGEPASASGGPAAYAGLYFIGFFHSLRGHLWEANRASRRLARHIQRYLSSAA